MCLSDIFRTINDKIYGIGASASRNAVKYIDSSLEKLLQSDPDLVTSSGKGFCPVNRGSGKSGSGKSGSDCRTMEGRRGEVDKEITSEEN